MKADIRLKTLNEFTGNVQFISKLNMFKCTDTGRGTTYLVPSSSIVYLIELEAPKAKQSTTKRTSKHKTTRKSSTKKHK